MKKVLSTIILIIVVWGFGGCSEKAQQGMDYNFENGTADWKALGKVQIAQSNAKQHDGKSSMKISGVGQAGLWSFVQSGRISILPGKHYRFDGWMLVDSLGSGTTNFKCEFWKDGTWIKNVESTKYDLNKLGQWQELTAEFDSPNEKGLTLSITVEKRPMEKDVETSIYVDSIKLQVFK